jgi:hypothetical protein
MKIASYVVVACISPVLAAGCSSSSASGGAQDGGASGEDSAAAGGSSGGSSGAGGGSSGGSSSGGSSSGGESPVVLLANGKNVGGIAANGTDVVFTSTYDALGNLTGSGAILSISPDGGTPVAIASNADQSGLVAMDGTNAYWAGPDDGTILKAPLTGGDGGAETLVQNLVDDPLDVVADSTYVYWAGTTTVQKVAIAGGPKTILAKDLALAGVFQQPCVAVNATAVFASTATTILSVPLEPDAGAPTTLVSNQSPNAITADATNVYWTNLPSSNQDGGAAGPAVMKVVATGGNPVTLVALASGTLPTAIAVDATTVYWIEALGSVRKVAIAGGPPVTLAGAPENPGGIAVDATSVYWTDTATGDVYKTAK